MELNKIKCKNCKFFSVYYINCEAQFKKTEKGLCIRLDETTSINDKCMLWEETPLRTEIKKRIVLTEFNKLVKKIIELNGILDNEN